MMGNGKFIVIEGTDGTGKGTQLKLLKNRLEKNNKKTAEFDFPQYKEPSAYFAAKYLKGDYGSLGEIGPYKASLFFALDRFEASFKIRDELKNGNIVISNRYVGSNMGHQGSKIDSYEKRNEYFSWLDDIEFGKLGIPRPDLNIILHAPAEIAQHLVDKKGYRKYVGGKKRDIHEKDLNHLQNTEKTYLEMAKIFPEKFTVLECMDGDTLMSVEKIHEKIWKLVKNEIGL